MSRAALSTASLLAMKSRVTLFVGLAATLGLGACAYGTSPASGDGSGGSSKGDPQAAGDVSANGDAAAYDNNPTTTADAEPADAGTTTDAGPGTDAGATTPDTGAPPPSATPPFGAGELLVSEVLFNPSGSEPDEEWFEVTNRATSARSLNGLVLGDGSGNSYTIPATPSLDVPAQGYVILARNKTVAISAGLPSAMIVHEYSAITLANGSTGGLTIKAGTTTLANVPFGQWSGALDGESIQLKDLAAPTTASSWCFSAASWSAGTDKGTPGQQADCP
jgi:Lamin Tail Domain